MSLYTVALFVHILGVLALFIGIGLAWTTLLRLRHAQTLAQVHDQVRLIGVQMRFPQLGLVGIFLAGAYMTTTTWGWDTPWIVTALAAFLSIGALGGGLIDRRFDAIQRATLKEEADGPIPAALRHQLTDPVPWAALQVATMLAVGVVFLMTNKPGWAGSLVTLAIAGGLGVVLARPWRQG